MTNNKEQIRILIADDHALFREGLRSLLEDQRDIEVVGEAEDGLQVERMAQTLQPDVILMDINMPVIDGVEATRTILQQNDSIGIVVLTMHRQDEYVFDALRAGAKAYLLKDTRSRRLLEVIRTVSQGQSVIEPDMASRLLKEFRRLGQAKEKPQPAYQKLSDQERRILSYVAEGASNKEIAEAMSLAERTVKNYLTVIFQKLQVNNRTEAAIRAVKDGLVK
ncbi:MAG TPA: response regulator transcription factor [Chloroflexi bacterium]|nr:MAG: DNA-binding response regulator [Anaerolineaceae bacterium 4572_5.2]HEY83665.1 response regulator transcription factor [Chloroflexota bacterium]